MAINVVSVQHNINRGFPPGIIILLTQCYYHRGTRFKCHEEVLYLQPMIPPKRVDIFPTDWGCSEGLDAFSFFLQATTTSAVLYPSGGVSVNCVLVPRCGWIPGTGFWRCLLSKYSNGNCYVVVCGRFSQTTYWSPARAFF